VNEWVRVWVSEWVRDWVCKGESEWVSELQCVRECVREWVSEWVCVFVCARVCVCVHLCASVCIFLHLCVCACTYVCVCICVCTHMYTYASKHTQKNIHTSLYPTYIHAHTYTHFLAGIIREQNGLAHSFQKTMCWFSKSKETCIWSHTRRICESTETVIREQNGLIHSLPENQPLYTAWHKSVSRFKKKNVTCPAVIIGERNSFVHSLQIGLLCKRAL